MPKYFLFFISVFIFSASAHAYPVRVVAVTDGDTITIEPTQGGARERVRLHGIDCPEIRQPYGQIARGFVQNHVLWKQVDVQPTPQGRDRYGRIVAVVVVPGVGVLQELLLESGLTWVEPNYCRNCTDWKEMERQARRQGKGLWGGDGPVAPWVWRRR